MQLRDRSHRGRQRRCAAGGATRPRGARAHRSPSLEYGDYECPYCAAAAPILRELVVDLARAGSRLVFRNFPLFEVHPHALTAALAAESTAASGAESAFWAMHFKLFEQQARLTDRTSGSTPRQSARTPTSRSVTRRNSSPPMCRRTTRRDSRRGWRAPRRCSSTASSTPGAWTWAALQRATGLPGDGRARRRPWQRRQG